jgi:monoamine oxidase
MTEVDTIIVGAGLAGAAAALKLARAGQRVQVIEARSRCGGRGYARPYGGDGPQLEFGGAWITPWHHRIRALAQDHGLTLRPRHPVTDRLWLSDGKPSAERLLSYAEATAHERAIARVAADSILLKKGLRENEKGEPLTGIAFSAYLDRLQCPKPTRDLFSAWWTVSGNGNQDAVAASEFLASCSYDSGLAEGMINFWSDTVAPGMDVLATRMIAAAGAELVLAAPVTAISQTFDGVEVRTGPQMHRARACVVALGVNQLRTLRFSPELSHAKRDAIATGHGGRSFKLWIRAAGVPVGTLVTGDGTGIEFAFAERMDSEGTAYIVAFGLMREENHPSDAAWVKAQAARLFPNARVISHDWHDWVDDPFSRGTWVAALAGHEAGLDAENWQPEGRIAFASSDYARQQAGWFEGAVIAGEEAADAVLKLS